MSINTTSITTPPSACPANPPIQTQTIADQIAASLQSGRYSMLGNRLMEIGKLAKMSPQDATGELRPADVRDIINEATDVAFLQVWDKEQGLRAPEGASITLELDGPGIVEIHTVRQLVQVTTPEGSASATYDQDYYGLHDFCTTNLWQEVSNGQNHRNSEHT